MTEPLLSVERSGSGDPLLLLHGMGSTRRDFTSLLPALSERFEVLAMDLPGCGRSATLGRRPTVAAICDAVERTLDAQEVGQVHVLGNSLGARVALELAKRGRARSVVALAPSGLNVLPERVFQGSGMALARLALSAVRPAVEPMSRSVLGRSALLWPLKARFWATSREEVLAARDGFADSRDYWQTLLWALLLDVPRGMGAVRCPVTLVQGTADWISSGQTPRYLALVPGARFRPLLAAGHAGQSDRPGAVVRLVEEAAAAAGSLRAA